MAYRPSPTSSSIRSAETAALIARKGTDLARWSRVENLATQWDERARLAASMIDQPCRVLDVGAGAMTVRNFLAAECDYIPADVVQRSEACLVADLNRHEFPPGTYDVVTFLGVLEYLHEPGWALRAAARAAPRLVVSYCVDISGDIGYRRGLGWVNDLTESAFLSLLAETWIAVKGVEYKRSANNIQYLWKCERREAP